MLNLIPNLKVNNDGNEYMLYVFSINKFDNLKILLDP